MNAASPSRLAARPAGAAPDAQARLRVVLLVDSQLRGGLVTHSCGLAEHLAGRGHDVTILFFGHESVVREGLSETTRVRLAASGEASFDLPVQKLWRVLRGQRADVGILAKNWVYTGSRRLDFLARWSFRRYVTIEHSLAPPAPARGSSRHLGGLVPGLGLWWYRQALARWSIGLWPQRILCVAEAIRDRLVTDYHFARRRLRVVHNGVDTQRFRRSAEAARRARAAWGIPEDALLFGSLGRLSREKALEIAIRGLAHLRREDPRTEAWLVLVGEGDDESRLRALAGEAGVADRVRFAGYTRAPWGAYSAIDVFLLPSQIEGLPLSLLEAMAADCCVVATDAGGVREILSGPEQGFCVPRGDEAKFCRAMEQAAALGRVERESMARRGRERVRRHFELSTQLERLASEIEALGVPS